MFKEYDVEKLNPRPNPYAKAKKKQVMLNLDTSVIEFFKEEATEAGIPYQTLINLYLTECVKEKKKLKVSVNPCGDIQ